MDCQCLVWFGGLGGAGIGRAGSGSASHGLAVFTQQRAMPSQSKEDSSVLVHRKNSGKLVRSGHTIERLPDGRRAFVWLNSHVVGNVVDGKVVHLPKEEFRYECNGRQVYDSDGRLLPNEAMEASVAGAAVRMSLGS